MEYINESGLSGISRTKGIEIRPPISAPPNKRKRRTMMSTGPGVKKS